MGYLCIIQLQISYSVYSLCAKNYENWLTVDKVIATKPVCSFLATLYSENGDVAAKIETNYDSQIRDFCLLRSKKKSAHAGDCANDRIPEIAI